jgi:hypothetical protein
MTSPIVQIFPMSDDYLFPGQTINAFFQNDLLVVSAHRPTAGRFNYRRDGVQAAPGTLLLFQYGGVVRAHGELVGRGSPDQYSAKDSNGYLLLDPASVRFYRRPVTLADLQTIWPTELGNLSSLNQRRWKLAAAGRAQYATLVAMR